MYSGSTSEADCAQNLDNWAAKRSLYERNCSEKHSSVLIRSTKSAYSSVAIDKRLCFCIAASFCLKNGDQCNF